MLFQNRSRTRTYRERKIHRGGLTIESLENRYLLASDLIGVPDAFSFDAVSVEDVTRRAATEPFVPGELIVAKQISSAKSTANQILSAIDWSTATGVDAATSIRTLMTVEQSAQQSVSLVHLDLGAGTDIMAAMRRLDDDPSVLWSSPNFVFAGADPRDLIPNDPQFGAQYHHVRMDNINAWDISLGNPDIVVGITDDGTDLQHEDLSAAIWQNPGEIPGDGIDNDGNGYIDDVNGYNFLNNNNNPDALPGDNHGTHVSGIVAATINNSIGTVGTAAGSTVLPLKWYDGGTWTAAIIAETFTYAADNGVDIVNTSYNMDSWANDAVVHAAFDYMYDAGVLHFNSAGNGSALNPPRQVFVESLLVASTESSDAKSGFSNYGVGVDIAAPGGSILSTTPNNTYSVFSGTSMASPNAAAVAALIWSANPTWSREQVAAQLLATADNIDAQNPSFVGLLGAGRANSFNALSQTIAPPTVKSLTGLPADGGILSTSLTGFDVSFSQIMDPASVNTPSNYELRNAGFDGIFNTSDDDLVLLSLADTYKIGSNSVHVDISASSLGFGEYRLSLLSGGLQNPFGTPLDGDGNGGGADNFVSHFTVEAPDTIAVAPLGSLVYQQSFPNSIDASDDTDLFAVELDPGQTLTVLVEGAVGLIPTVRIADPSGSVLADITATGQNVFAQSVTVDLPGSYLVTVGSDMDTIGGYDVTVLLNAAIETEGVDGSDNDTMGNAQNIDNSSVQFGNFTEILTADRLAVVGALPSSQGDPVDGDDFESGALDSRWTTATSTTQGRIRVSSAFGAAGGSFALMMDVGVDNTNNLNEAIWAVDLTGINSPKLSFFHAEWSDEENPLPVAFSGSVNGDGVSISDDGVNWHRVFNPTSQTTAQWINQTIDLTTAANNAGISLGANFRVKFQQFDNFSLTTDGRGYDEISILEPSSAADWYSFTLDAGARATIGATAAGSGSVVVDLFDAAGTPVATGVSSDNVSNIISQFQATSAGTYFVRLSGQDAAYSLFVTRNAEFDTESNNNLPSAQSLNGLQGVVGHVSATTGVDVYSVSATVGEELTFAARLPAGGPLLFENPLATPSGSDLRMELRDPSGVVVAMDSTSIAHIAAQSGDYSLTVSAASLSGEYFIAVNEQTMTPNGDFDGDGDYDCDDVDALVNAIVTNSGVPIYDLSGDGLLTEADLDLWLAVAGSVNLPSGNAYLKGDANLDGLVDGFDFIEWNAHKFTPTAAWCQGDFNADGITDGLDFILWNANKFTSAQLTSGTDTKSIQFGINNQALKTQSQITSPAEDMRFKQVAATTTVAKTSQRVASHRLHDKDVEQDERTLAIDLLFAR